MRQRQFPIRTSSLWPIAATVVTVWTTAIHYRSHTPLWTYVLTVEFIVTQAYIGWGRIHANEAKFILTLSPKRKKKRDDARKALACRGDNPADDPADSYMDRS